MLTKQNITSLIFTTTFYIFYWEKNATRAVVHNLFCSVDPEKSKYFPRTPKVFKALSVDPYIPLKEV